MQKAKNDAFVIQDQEVYALLLEHATHHAYLHLYGDPKDARDTPEFAIECYECRRILISIQPERKGAR